MATKSNASTTAGDKYVKIAEIRPYMKAINCVFIVLDKDPPTKTKDEHSIYQCLVADYTGSMYISLWDTNGEQVQPGDIVKLKGGYATLFKGSLILYCGKKGSLERVGEFTMVFSELPNMSLMQWVTDSSNSKNYIPLPPGQPTPPGTTLAFMSNNQQQSSSSNPHQQRISQPSQHVKREQ